MVAQDVRLWQLDSLSRASATATRADEESVSSALSRDRERAAEARRAQAQKASCEGSRGQPREVSEDQTI